ncbi:MAG TPA: hypothetical protein VHH12_10655, partial [Mycobacterium sp.]|nr:hypothetical protein [Mycobacterium sp.]
MPQSDLPIPDYDQLPITEVRHRIRSLDEPQLRVQHLEHRDAVAVGGLVIEQRAQLRFVERPD